MFFLKEMERTSTAHASFLGPHIKGQLVQEIQRELEGSVQDNYFLIATIEPFTFSSGKVLPGSALLEYTAHFKALCWKPFKNETLEGIVGNVVESGFFVNIGPMECFVSRMFINHEYKFDSSASPPEWVDATSDLKISRGVQVRVRIMSIKPAIGSIAAIGTIDDDFLGPLETGS